MPGESPGRDWDALLSAPPPNVFQRRAAERAEHRRKWRMRWWKAACVAALAAVTWLWLMRGSIALLIPHVGFFVWMAEYPLLIAIVVIVLRRLERLVIPSAYRELEGEQAPH
jgi:hypothetical protein